MTSYLARRRARRRAAADAAVMNEMILSASELVTLGRIAALGRINLVSVRTMGRPYFPSSRCISVYGGDITTDNGIGETMLRAHMNGSGRLSPEFGFDLPSELADLRFRSNHRSRS